MITVVYYSANRENEKFENKIVENLLEKTKDIPVISVTQKPMDVGTNICIGDVGISEINARRQLLIGAKEAKTKYIAVAEADFLYPEEYFKFIPRQQNMLYLAHPTYVLFCMRGRKIVYCPKSHGSEGAMIASRRYLIHVLEYMLKDFPDWYDKEYQKEHRYINELLLTAKFRTFSINIPPISFKTDNGMHRGTPCRFSGKTRDLPYWGECHELVRKFL